MGRATRNPSNPTGKDPVGKDPVGKDLVGFASLYPPYVGQVSGVPIPGRMGPGDPASV